MKELRRFADGRREERALWLSTEEVRLGLGFKARSWGGKVFFRGVGDPYLSVLVHDVWGVVTGSSWILIRLVLGVLMGLFSGEVRCSISS
jgi:hypothetical protein